ncbi:MAG: hypothetical protein JRI25_09860 [Deltaproteobacteria bacterium]|nr:hypothetical protein [Deltaproteobacteria bacterium]MBW2254885.1 hypothetical protein [Deltaproteobacteria bacterium]
MHLSSLSLLLTLAVCKAGAPDHAVEAPMKDVSLEKAYEAWILANDRGFDDLDEAFRTGEAGVVLREAGLSRLPGVRLVHGAGSYDGGHEFLPQTWLWVQGDDVRFVDPSVGSRYLDDKGYRTSVDGLFACSLRAAERRAGLLEDRGDPMGAFERVRAEREAIVAEECVDVLPALRQAFLDDTSEPATDRAATFLTLLLQLQYGGYTGGILTPDLRALQAAEVRWRHAVEVTEMTVASLEDGVEASGFGWVSDSDGSWFLLSVRAAITTQRWELIVERVGSTVVYIE